MSTFDLVFMDITMPKMDGLEATSLIREQEQNSLAMPTPIIALSGHAQAADITRAINAGMNDYMVKPFSKDLIYDKIAHWTTQQVSSQSVESLEPTSSLPSPSSPR